VSPDCDGQSRTPFQRPPRISVTRCQPTRSKGHCYTSLGNTGRARPYAPPGSRQHRQRRLRLGLRRDSSARGLLLVEVCVPWVLRIHTSGTPARRQSRALDHGASACGQYPSVRLVRDNPRPAPPTGGPHLPARGSCQVHPAGCSRRASIEDPRILEQNARIHGHPLSWVREPVRGPGRVGWPAHWSATTK
jgi:hypothetical protein